MTEKQEKQVLIFKNNLLVQSQYAMKLNEKRLLLLAISKIDFFKPVADRGIDIEITASEYWQTFGGNVKNCYRDLKAATDGLKKRGVTITGKGFDEKYFNWVETIEYHTNARIIIRFSFSIMFLLSSELLTDNHGYTPYLLSDVVAMNSIYSVRIYEICRTWIKEGKQGEFKYITIEELKRMLGIEGKYPNYAELKRRIIDPSISDINKNTPLKLDYYPVKARDGKKVLALNFFPVNDEQIPLI